MNSITDINFKQAEGLIATYYLRLANGDSLNAKKLKVANLDLKVHNWTLL